MPDYAKEEAEEKKSKGKQHKKKRVRLANHGRDSEYFLQWYANVLAAER